MNRSLEERLMRYLDGELDPEQAALVERWLARSDEAAALRAELELVRREVRGIAAERCRGAGDIADAVMARIETGSSFGQNWRGQRSQGSQRAWILAGLPAVGLAFAAAATVVAFLRPHAETRSVVREPAPVAVSPEPMAAAPADVSDPAAPDAEGGASIESVDFGAQNGAIFIVATGPQTTPVVWLTDDADPSSG